MHTYEASDDTIFNFNSDMSGDVRIYRDGKEMWVPGDDILEFIGEYVRANKIRAIESMSSHQLLGELKNG